MKHLILLVGSLQSGKTSTATSIMGHYLTGAGTIPNFSMREDGSAFITYNMSQNLGFEFDIDSNDPNTKEWFSQTVWPWIKNASFATELKNTLINLFGLKHTSVYGTNKQKNKKTHIKIKNIICFAEGDMLKEFELRLVKNPEDCATGREMMQIFGTQICRKINPYCHIEAGINILKKQNPEIGIIPDCRFDNELLYFIEGRFKYNPEIYNFMKKVNIVTIKLTRILGEIKHEAEMACPGIPEDVFKLVVHNQDMEIYEKNKIVIDYLCEEKVLFKSKVKEKGILNC